jgi:FkbM family methyltransferase
VRASLQELQQKSHYAQFVESGQIVFDVGANVGNRTAIFSRLGATVIAIEPQADCVAILERRFERHANVHVLHTALSNHIGIATLKIADENTLSTLSDKWMSAVKSSGRFANNDWTGTEEVSVTTLDKVIEKFGLPSFCKIDVEGGEVEVISGLNQPIDYVSFEFTPEVIDIAIATARHLSHLGNYAFNFSLGETLRFHSSWQSFDDLCETLKQFDGDRRTFGDVYAKRTK